MDATGMDALEIVAIGEPLVELTAEQPGPLHQARRFRRGWGGDTSNVVIAAARLGAACGYLTRLGNDGFGRSFLDLWAEEGIDTSRVQVEEGAYTGLYLVHLSENGQREFTYYRAHSAASRLAPEHIDPGYLGSARILHFSGISQALSGTARAALRTALEVGRGRGVTISYDANVRPKLGSIDSLRDTFEETVSEVDILFISQDDAGLLYPDVPPNRLLEDLIRSGPDLVVLLSGSEGCSLRTRDGQISRVTGWRVDALDTTGAGDAFVAAFLVEHLRGEPPIRAAAFANAVGALAAAGWGAVDPLPRRRQVEELMAAQSPQPTV